MLTIRLSRGGKHKSPFYRVVLTESTRAVQSGYKDILGWFDPINHKMELNVEKAKELVNNGAQMSERVAKLFFSQTKDQLFTKFFKLVERKGAVKNPKE